MSKSFKRYHGDFVRNCIAFWLSLILALALFALIAVDDSEVARADDSMTAANPESTKVTHATPGLSEPSAVQAFAETPIEDGVGCILFSQLALPLRRWPIPYLPALNTPRDSSGFSNGIRSQSMASST
jgi:hypothetical protein